MDEMERAVVRILECLDGTELSIAQGALTGVLIHICVATGYPRKAAMAAIENQWTSIADQGDGTLDALKRHIKLRAVPLNS